MPFEEIIAELKIMFRAELDGTGFGTSTIRDADIARWSTSLNTSASALFDRIALYLAVKFQQNELTFESCDSVVNDIFPSLIGATDEWPELFGNVYLAFDDGEYYHCDNPDRDPIDAYTRPMIAEIVAKHVHENQ